MLTRKFKKIKRVNSGRSQDDNNNVFVYCKFNEGIITYNVNL